jgi:hypothetical protein
VRDRLRVPPQPHGDQRPPTEIQNLVKPAVVSSERPWLADQGSILIGTKGVMLAETKMAELSSGVIKPEDNNDEIKGDFGMLYPGYAWRFKFQPTEVNDFLAVALEIGHRACRARRVQTFVGDLVAVAGKIVGVAGRIESTIVALLHDLRMFAVSVMGCNGWANRCQV